LDNSASIEEVIASDKKIRPCSSDIEQVHFFLSDKIGRSAVIEFLRGKMIVHTGEELPVPLITNYKYDSEIKKLIDYVYFQRENSLSYLCKEPANMDTWEKESINNGDIRSVIGTNILKKHQRTMKKNLIPSAFKILEALRFYSKNANFFFNQFSIVFDPVNMQIYYSTKKNPIIQKLDFSDFDLATPSVGVMYSMDKDIFDVKNEFIPFSKELNKKNIDLLLESNKQFHKLLELSVNDSEYKKMEMKFSELAEYPASFKYNIQ
jgi:penicillin V acylase-like amidase (Ntn superfamily)